MEMKRIILPLTVIFFGLWFLHDIYFDGIDLLEITEHQARMLWLLAAFRDISFIALMVLIFLDTFSSYQISKYKKAYLVMLFIYPVTLAFVSLGYFYAERITTGLLPSQEEYQKDADEIAILSQEVLNSDDKSLEEKVRFSSMAGSFVYTNSGEIIDVMTESGNVIAYRPSQEDLEFRENMLATYEMVSWKGKSLRNGGYIWLSLFVIYLVIAAYYIRKGIFRSGSMRRAQ